MAAYLDGIVRAERLPQKVMVFHQVAAKVVREQSAIRSRPGVAVIKSVDGIGSRSAKTDTWRVLVRDLPRGVRPGFKAVLRRGRPAREAHDAEAGAGAAAEARLRAVRVTD
ncbi:hypothetical protein GCM10025868_20340 [Angustibacter aerolatus]|uniref:Uncharacterized protein n=1 Tax=Angustibacter aerolatus TaxID=1162965 RepID=A0ABQ6JHE8_9ACTN|nr:hypothetical protein [Angustibacter aerolatus]GMA86784.1 hypothetical protein GCM10025868_20340 [Angustibacter aerolatus]